VGGVGVVGASETEESGGSDGTDDEVVVESVWAIAAGAAATEAISARRRLKAHRTRAERRRGDV
jgi:hypothetical protein